MPEYTFKVEELKTRLDKFLVSRVPEVSRSQIQRAIEGGDVDVNDQPVRVSKFVVRLNDTVTYRQSSIPPEAIRPSNTPLKVLYNANGLIVIDKPAGLTVHPGAGFKGETLASALLYHFKNIQVVGEDHRPGIVHRLDKDTSGVILVAATQPMYEYLKDAFADRKIKKEYIALVKGRLEKPHGFIDTPIGKSKTDFRKQTAKDPVEAKEALTEYRVLEYLSEIPTVLEPVAGHVLPKDRRTDATVDTYSLILVKLHTGRTHQIRVHFSGIGFPLLGDDLYGGKKVQIPGLHRQFLHAKKIEVRLTDGTWIEAESDLPADLRGVLTKLGSKVAHTL